MNPKILLWDIETSHLKADFGTLLCVGYKWWGDARNVHVPCITDYPSFKKDPTNDYFLTRDFLKIYNQADLTITYFGSGFDIKFLQAKVLEHHLQIPPKIPMCDLFYTVKSNLALSRKSLQNVGYHLGFSNEKTPVEGKIWKRAGCGHRESLKYIVDHCRADVLLLEEAYKTLRPLIRSHPRMASNYEACKYCGGMVIGRGPTISVTKGGRQRVQCKSCGAWETRPLRKIAVVG